MTHKQAMQEARETAMQSGRTQIVYWFKPHWWSLATYNYIPLDEGDYYFDYAIRHLICVIQRDGRTH